MNALDLYILIPVVGGLIAGLFRGFVKEVIGIASIILGIFFAKLFNPPVAHWIGDFFNTGEKSSQVLAFIIIFLLVAMLLKILGKIMERTLKFMSLGILNKLLGAIAGGIKWLLVVSLVLNLMYAVNEKISFMDQETTETSLLYKPVKSFGPVLWKDLKQKENHAAK